MVQTSFPFDKKKDVSEVNQFAFIDLRQSFVDRTVPSEIADNDSEYEDCPDPSAIVGKPEDVFEAFRMRDSINASKETATSKGEQD